MNDQSIPFTGERFTPETAGSIALEHYHRYAFARHACKGKRVLDIACGEGYGSNLLAEVAESVTGVDISEEAIAHASARYQRPNLAFMRGDCANIPLPDRSVDVVVSFETIEHHDRHEEMLKEIKRVLVPKGLLVVSSPDRREYSEVPGTRNPFHVKELDRSELDQLLRHNFKRLVFYGQRVVFGSAIIAETGETSIESFSLADGVDESSAGLRRPLYFVVLATDGALPRIPGGLLETPLSESEELRWWIRAVEERDQKLREQIARNEELRASLASAPADGGSAELSLPVSIATLYGSTAIDGSVFDEGEATHVTYLADNRLQWLTLRLPRKSPPFQTFRLDIANRICCVDIEAVLVKSGEQVVWRWSPAADVDLWSRSAGMVRLHSADIEGARFICTDADPQCLLTLPANVVTALGSGGALQLQLRASHVAPHDTPGLADFARILASELDFNRQQLAKLADNPAQEQAVTKWLAELEHAVEEVMQRSNSQLALHGELADRLSEAMAAVESKSARLDSILTEQLVLREELADARREIHAAQVELSIACGGEQDGGTPPSVMNPQSGLAEALAATRNVLARARARADAFELKAHELERAVSEHDIAHAELHRTQIDLLSRLQTAEALIAVERARASELEARCQALELSLKEGQVRLAMAEEAARARSVELQERLDVLALRAREADAAAVRASVMHEHAASALTAERARVVTLTAQSQEALAAAEARNEEHRATAAHERACLQAHVAELERAMEDLRSRLEREMEAVRQQGKAETQRFAADAAAQRSNLERVLREAADLRQALDAVQISLSWRITTPLRGLAAAVRSGGVLAPLRALSSRLLRGVYRQLPISFETKRKIKDWVFTTMPAPFQGTGAYRQWKAFSAETAALRTMRFDPAPTVPAREAGGAVLDPQQEATGAEALPQQSLRLPPASAETGPVGEQVSKGEAALPALALADGRWEWADYAAVSEHIQHGLQQQRSATSIEPIEILDFNEDQLDARIAELYFPPVSNPKVTVLVPTFGNLKYTVECLSSIATVGATVSFEVLIADDASEDGTPDRLTGVPNLRMLRHAENLNFLRNVNRALPHVRGQYCLLLNNDVQVTSGWLDALVDAADADPRIGAVGPRIVYPSGHLQEAGCSFRPDCTSDMVGLTQAANLPQFSYRRAVDYCSGAALLLRTTLFREVGGFSEEFAPAYCEDSDLCLKLRAAGYRIEYEPRSTVVHHLSKTTAAQDSAAKLALIGRNLDRFAQKWQATIDTLSDVRLICFYLPQFHAIPENDRWWGQGFTEWRNVAKAKPNFVGHYQPRFPADLGYYDLRVAEVMDHQAELARRYGIGGFCYYYYWFAGKRLLEMPLERMVQTGKPNLPFCLCWANENWTRRWDGQDQEVLMAQAHSDQDDEAVILDLIRYMRLQHYIRIDGRPLLLVYRVNLFPDFARTAETWRRICREQGVGEIYLAMVESFEMVFKPVHPSKYGCDAAVEFPPQGMAETRQPSGPVVNPSYKGQVGDYRELAVRYCLRPHVPYTRFRGIMPGWDNTARRQDHSFAFEHATPGAFQAWAEHIIDQTRTMRSGDERIVFVNAWNEWAEGAYLEPDRRFGHAFLEAIRNARDAASLKRRNRYMLG